VVLHLLHLLLFGSAAAADTYIRQLVQLISSAFHFPSALPFLWNRLRDTLACMAADGKDIPYARAARRWVLLSSLLLQVGIAFVLAVLT
jgi:hypothetical protein